MNTRIKGWLLTGVLVMTQAAMADKAPVAIAIHGGAGTILKKEMTEKKEAAIRAKLSEAVNAGHDVLEKGGTALEAVTSAVTILEDSPLFNAGKGAVFNAEGDNELDASIMDGATRNAGAVASVRTVKNPILAALAVMNHSPHVMLMGDGAEQFARKQHLELVDPEYFHTDFRQEQLRKIQERESLRGEYRDSWFSTVGAVALDADGNLAAGTSTGGMSNKRFGRVGDSPIIGAGTYADNRSCAVSSTGHGEYFIRAVVAYKICARMELAGESLQDAAAAVVNDELVKFGGSGGVISVDRDGNIALTFNTAGMYRASIDVEGKETVRIYQDPK